MARLKLTADNYYSQEANMAYMSASQFKAFRKCEAAAMAELRGELPRKETTALLVGSYVDAHFSGELDQYREAHPEIFKKDGSLKADFQNAEKVIQRIEEDELARMLLSGKNQVIKTAKIGGVWFKVKFDSLLTARQVESICKKFPQIRELVPFGGAIIVDLKCMRDLDDVWDKDAGEYVTFAEFWGYDIQGAIYQAADKRNAPFVIVAVTKEEEPDVDALHIPDDDLSFSLSEVEDLAPRYDAIKRGEISPVGCGKCAYCRSIKRLSGVRHYKQVRW